MQDLGQVIGHEKIVASLLRAVDNGRLAHAYLFVGPERVGKAALARWFAASLLSGAPLHIHPDFTFVGRACDPKTGKAHGAIVLEQVHDLCGRLAKGAMMGGRKVCVLDGADLLHKEAANALLKNLEEPHPGTVLLLLASADHAVLPTIRSRCQTVRVDRVPATVIADALEARGTSRERAELFARLSAGCPGRAIAYAEDPAAFAAMTALRDRMLGVLTGNVAERWRAIDALLPPKLAFQDCVDRSRSALDLIGELLRDAMLLSCGEGRSVSHVDVRDRLSDVARRDPSALARAAAEVLSAKRLLAENVNPRAVLDGVALSCGA